MGILWDGGSITEPIDLNTAKLHLRVDDPAEDALISLFISAARQYCENETGKILVSQNWTLTLDRFPETDPFEARETISVYPRSGVIELPLTPVSAVNSVKYYDTDGVQQALVQNTDYQVDLTGVIARIQPAYGKTWALTREMLSAVEIKFAVGSAAPEQIKAAMLLLIGAFFENRQAVISGMPVSQLPKPLAVSNLLAHYKILTV